jgi:hypothetical protein
LRYLYCCVEYVYTLLLYRKKHPTDASFISSPCVYNNSTSCYLTSVCMLSIFFTKKKTEEITALNTASWQIAGDEFTNHFYINSGGGFWLVNNTEPEPTYKITGCTL